MLLDLDHFTVTPNLHWKLQTLYILYVNIVNADWQIFLSPILLVIAKWVPKVRVCFDITSFHIYRFKFCNGKQAKWLVFNKEPHKLMSNFNMYLGKAQEKDLCKTSSIIKARGFTTLLPCLEIEGAISPETKGVLITPWIGITSRFLFFAGPCETSTPFPLWWENEFSIPPTSQIPFINSSPLYVSSSLFALQKPARSPLPSQKDTLYKVSPLLNTFSQADFSISSLEYWFVST